MCPSKLLSYICLGYGWYKFGVICIFIFLDKSQFITNIYIYGITQQLYYENNINLVTRYMYYATIIA